MSKESEKQVMTIIRVLMIRLGIDKVEISIDEANNAIRKYAGVTMIPSDDGENLIVKCVNKV